MYREDGQMVAEQTSGWGLRVRRGSVGAIVDGLLLMASYYGTLFFLQALRGGGGLP